MTAPDFWRDGENPAKPAPGAALAASEDVGEGQAIVRDFAAGDARFSLLLARRGGAVFGYFNICPHARMPLERLNGSVIVEEGRYILCAAHLASFAIETGACAGGPAIGRALRAFPVSERDGGIFAA